MKRIVRASAVVCAMALGACVGGSSAPRAGLDRGPTLEGVDVDGNGIRDDIEAFIESQLFDGDSATRCSTIGGEPAEDIAGEQGGQGSAEAGGYGGWPRGGAASSCASADRTGRSIPRLSAKSWSP